MGSKYHIDGTEEFGYIAINRFLYSFYMYMNTVKRLTNLYDYANVQFLKGYVAHFCYLRLMSFDTLIKVVLNNKDYLSSNCILRMLGDSVAVFRLIYMEPDIRKIADTFEAFRNGTLEDEAGYCAVKTLQDIAAQDYILTPGRYVGIAEQEDDGEPFAEKMQRLTSELSGLFAESHRLEDEIKKQLGSIGFEI